MATLDVPLTARGWHPWGGRGISLVTGLTRTPKAPQRRGPPRLGPQGLPLGALGYPPTSPLPVSPLALEVIRSPSRDRGSRTIRPLAVDLCLQDARQVAEVYVVPVGRVEAASPPEALELEEVSDELPDGWVGCCGGSDAHAQVNRQSWAPSMQRLNGRISTEDRCHGPRTISADDVEARPTKPSRSGLKSAGRPGICTRESTCEARIDGKSSHHSTRVRGGLKSHRLDRAPVGRRLAGWCRGTWRPRRWWSRS